MIIKIEETNTKNKFEIKVNGKSKYLAGIPWIELDKQLDVNKKGTLIITKKDENICYLTQYNRGQDLVKSFTPRRLFPSKKKENFIFNIKDSKNNNCGKFYRLKSGFLDTKYIIEYGEYILKCYDISRGKTQHILIYKNDTQIAEIIRKFSKCEYYLFLLDEYSNLETILSFFVIYFDYKSHFKSDTFDVSVTTVEYTYNKNNKYYNKDWLTNNFKEEIDILNE